MKRSIIKYLIFALLTMAALPSLAQNPDNHTSNLNAMGQLTKEQEAERDAVNQSGNFKTGNPLSQDWSGWSINPHKYQWNIPIPDYSSTAQRQGGLVFSNDPQPTTESKNYYKREKEARDRITQNQINNLNKGNANFQENVARMQHNAEIRKQRIEAENAADRERGRREYYMRTAGFHAHNAALDQWMATEGVRQLESVHAMNMASVPKAKREDKLNLKDGNELADMLKDKEQGITIKVVVVERDIERKNKSGVALYQQKNGRAAVIDLYDGGGYDETNSDLWQYSVSDADAYITLPPKVKTTKDYEKTLLFKKTQLDLEGLYLTTLPGMGCVALMGDSFALLDNDKLAILEWGKGLDVTEVATCGARTFAKQQDKIIEIKRDGTAELAAFKTENFSIYPETDTTLIVCAYALDMTIVIRFNVERMKYDEILRITQPIEKICANGKVVFALNGNRIVDIDPSPVLFFQAKEKINDIAMCHEGLLVATDKDVTLLRAKDDIAFFSKEGAQRLWCDGEDIYLLDKKGNFYRYSKKQ